MGYTMRYLQNVVVLFLAASGCGSDDQSAPPRDVDASLPDAGATADAPDAGRQAARPDPNAPPLTQDGKKLYSVRFDSRVGDEPFACGTQAVLGTRNTLAEPIDMRFFVHDVALVRADGGRVPLSLHQDERYQRENVALLDFVDDTGGCATGDSDIRNVVHGYAPEDDYTGVVFKVGVPADKNHLDGAQAPAPYNASGLWWSWAGGYKYMRLELTSDVLSIWYFHGGATNCDGDVASGITCASRQIAEIALDDYDPEQSLVVFDAQQFFAASDVSTGDGCMGFYPDTECAPLYGTLGVVPWDDDAEAPAQSAFRLSSGPALVASKGSTAADRLVNDPSAWPDPDYERPAVLDVENVSLAGDTRSHAPDDPRHGVNCMRCHQEQGPGIGKFSAAGTVFDAAGRPAVDARVELFSADAVGYAQFENIVSRAILDVDAHGNFYTTAALPLDTTPLGARILGADGEPLLTMPFTQQTAACNNCHTGGFRLTLPTP